MANHGGRHRAPPLFKISGSAPVTHRIFEDFNEDKLPDEIINIGKLCSQYGVNDDLFRSIFVKDSVKLGKMISQANNIVSKKCEENGFHFISNGNILRIYLCRWHPFNKNLCRKYSRLYHFILKEFWNEVACNDSRFEGQNGYIDNFILEDSSENKDYNLKNKQHLNPLPEVKNLRSKNFNKTITGQIHINSISSNFDQLKE